MEWVDAYKIFSKEEYEAMSQIGEPIEAGEQPMEYIPQ